MDTEEFNPEHNQIFTDPRPWVERNGFAHWAVALFWVFAALILFQVIGGVIGAILLFPEIMDAVKSGADTHAIQQVFTDNLGKVFIGNSSGQFLIIGLASFLMAKLHATKGNVSEFLRLKLSPNVWQITALTAILTFAIMPANGFLGWLNYLVFEKMVQAFPGLQWFIETQDSMAEMIKGFISSENAVILAFIHIGIVPALFEEVMFRGYILRAFEKSWGIIAAILVSGLLFGMYHIQPSNVIPLSVLGILFAYVTYISDSLIPAMVAHLLNNGGQVIYGAMNPEFLEEELSGAFDWSVESVLYVIGSFIISAVLLYVMQKQKKITKETGNV